MTSDSFDVGVRAALEKTAVSKELALRAKRERFNRWERLRKKNQDTSDAAMAAGRINSPEAQAAWEAQFHEQQRLKKSQKQRASWIKAWKKGEIRPANPQLEQFLKGRHGPLNARADVDKVIAAAESGNEAAKKTMEMARRLARQAPNNPETQRKIVELVKTEARRIPQQRVSPQMAKRLDVMARNRRLRRGALVAGGAMLAGGLGAKLYDDFRTKSAAEVA